MLKSTSYIFRVRVKWRVEAGQVPPYSRPRGAVEAEIDRLTTLWPRSPPQPAMLSAVLFASSISASAGFMMNPKMSRRILNVRMSEDPWFPGSTTTNVVDLSVLE